MAIPLHELNADGTLTLPVVNDAVAAGVGGGSGQGIYLASANGLVGDNSTDNLSAWNALMTTMTKGGVVLMDTPGGVYRHSGTLNIGHDNIGVRGLGMGPLWSVGPTCFRPTYPSGDVFKATGNGVTIQDFTIQASVTRTGGFDVNFPTSAVTNAQLYRVQSLTPYDGFQLNSNSYACRDCRVWGSGSHNLITLNDSVSQGVVDGFLTDSAALSMPHAGIYSANCGALQISNCDIIHAGTDLYVDGGASIFATNSYFDTANAGLQVQGGVGNVLRCRFSNCWFCSHVNQGVIVQATNLTGISFDGCEASFNGAAGFLLGGSGVQKVSNCHMAANATDAGISVAVGNATSCPQILGNHIGSDNAMAGNAFGLFINAGTYAVGSYYAMNTIQGNTTANVSGSGINLTAGTNF